MSPDNWPSFVSLTHPGYLAVLAALPLVVLISLRSLAGLGPVRGPLAVTVRCVVVAVLALALAGPEWGRTTDDQTVTFAFDQSDSVPPARQREAITFATQAATGLRTGKDRVATLNFASHPAVDQLPAGQFTTDTLGIPDDARRTDIAAALRLGLALFPADTAKRLVLFSDGNENRGLAAEEADTYAALGIPIDVVPLPYEHAAEILVDHLSAPATATRGEVVNLQLIVRSQTDTTARLLLYHNDQLVTSDSADSSIDLSAGPNRLSMPIELQSPGVHRFRAVIQPEQAASDSVMMNNAGQAFTIVGDATRVLIVTDPRGGPDDAGNSDADLTSAETFAAALQEGGIDCDLITLDNLPPDPAALADTSALILSNISAFALGPARLDMISSYVRDQGGGLIVLGGDRAFSVGGYAHTPLDEILPVETGRAELKFLSLSMVIVIDCSGSMVGEKINMARHAAMASVELLSRLDRIGIVAFNDLPFWLVPLQLADNRDAILKRVATLGAGGGTDMYPALQQAFATLAKTDTNLRHIIVLTDGQSEPGPFDALAARCHQNGITISAIAVGPDADRPLLTRIAQQSGGRMYVADSAQPLPQIFARETILASHSGLFERPFTPRLSSEIGEPILQGCTPADIPPLRGHVVAVAKPTAHVPLVRATKDGTDPILAHWQVGLGRAVAFTSGLWSKWGPDWVAWSGFSKLWTQAVRYVARAGNPGELDVETVVRGSVAHVSVSAEHLPVRMQGSLSLAGQVVGPDFGRTSLQLQRTAAGRWEAAFALDRPGTYFLNLPYSYGYGGERRSGVLRTGVVQSYSPEYAALQHNHVALSELARRTGGRLLDLRHPDAVFEPWSIRPVHLRRPFWEDVVRLALVLFLLDVAVRRIAVSPVEVAGRIRRFIHELAGGRPAEASAVTLGALRGAKARAQAGSEAADRARAVDPRASDALSRALGGAEADKPIVVPPTRSSRPVATSEGDYMSRLRQAKQRAARSEDERDG